MNLRKIFLISILLLSHHKGMLSKEPTQQKPTSSSSTRKSKRKKTITFLLLSTPIIPVVRFTIKGKRFEGRDNQELINPPNQTSSKPLVVKKKATSKKQNIYS